MKLNKNQIKTITTLSLFFDKYSNVYMSWASLDSLWKDNYPALYASEAEKLKSFILNILELKEFNDEASATISKYFAGLHLTNDINSPSHFTSIEEEFEDVGSDVIQENIRQIYILIKSIKPDFDSEQMSNLSKLAREHSLLCDRGQRESLYEILHCIANGQTSHYNTEYQHKLPTEKAGLLAKQLFDELQSSEFFSEIKLENVKL
jgi:hypothetical protein